MMLFTKFAAAAGLAAIALSALPASADAQYRGGYGAAAWNGPEGYFTVNARACPDLREDFRDTRFNTGRADRWEDRRDRQVLHCPARAFDYVASRRELRMGRTGERLNPTVAYFDYRTGQYYVETRWRPVPVRIIAGRGFDAGHRGWDDYGRGHRGRHD